MADVITNAALLAVADGPSGRKPRARFSRRNIMIYGLLGLAAFYYILPLYVMIVTSLKGMPEIRLGNIFAPPVEITFEPWVKAWSQACTGLNCDGLSRRLLELRHHHRAERDRLDRHCLGEWLCARQLALQGFGSLLHHPHRRGLHSLSGDALPDGHHPAHHGHLWHADRADRRAYRLRHADPDAAVPQLFRLAAGGTVQGGRVDGAGFWGIFCTIMLPMSVPIMVVAMILQITGIWNDFLFGVVFTSRTITR